MKPPGCTSRKGDVAIAAKTISLVSRTRPYGRMQEGANRLHGMIAKKLQHEILPYLRYYFNGFCLHFQRKNHSCQSLFTFGGRYILIWGRAAAKKIFGCANNSVEFEKYLVQDVEMRDNIAVFRIVPGERTGKNNKNERGWFLCSS